MQVPVCLSVCVPVHPVAMLAIGCLETTYTKMRLGAQVSGAASKASDKAGSNTPDVNVPGFGPFKFNPKEDAKQAAKKSPLGFMNVGDFAFDLPGSGVSKDDLPNNVKPLEAKGLKDAPPNKTPSLPPLPQVSQQSFLNVTTVFGKAGPVDRC